MLDKIRECLKTDDFQKIQKIIGNQRSYPLFKPILEVIYENYRNREYPPEDEIEDFFKFYFAECDIDLVVLRLCSLVYYDIRNIRWMCKIFNVTYFQTLTALFHEWRTNNVEKIFRGPLGDPIPGPFIIACKRLLQATGDNPKEIDWMTLRRESYELADYAPEAIEYFAAMYTKHGDCAPIPEWCIFEAYPECEYSEDILTSKTLETKVDSALNLIKGDKEKLRVLQNIVLRFEPYPEGTAERDIDMINGLANPQLDEECVSFKGKCRMFTCRCHTGHKMGDWFEGKCDFCAAPISKPQHSVRYPMPEGGFSGCYCSIEHLMSYLLSIEINELMQKNTVEGKVQSEYKTTGLYDEEEELRLKIFFNILRQVKVKVHPSLI